MTNERRITRMAGLLAGLCSNLLIVSCATMAVSDKGHQEHQIYWSITKVLGARLSNDELWLKLELKRQDSNFTKSAALRLPTQDSAWLRDRQGKVTCPSAVPWTKASEVSPKATELLDSTRFPSTGSEIEIQNLELNNSEDLNEIKTTGDPWTILFVRFKHPVPGGQAKNEEMPVLALVRASDSGQESEKCILYTFFVGTTHHEGWVLVAPFAMAFDAVTLPFQLLALMWWLIAGE